jgi:ATP-dependent protease ClpP protease subunit
MNELTIYSDIDSQTGFAPQALRDALAEANGEPVTIRLNSEGGNVIDGLACYNLLRSYEGETTVVIDGMALSIASLVVCGADRAQMAQNAWMMVHNPHNQVAGTGDDLRDMAGLLDGMQDQLADVYTAKSKKPKEEIIQLMDAETWMTGPQALEAGFVDEVTASLEVAAEFDASRFSKPPTIQKEKETAMAAATYQELKAAFPRASADFFVTCQDKGYTLDKARAEFDEANAKALEETTKELNDVKAEFEKFKKDTEEEAKATEEEKKEAEAKAKAEEEEEKKAAEAKAKSGVTAAASGKAKGGQGAQSRFVDAINERIKLGMPKAQAVAETVRDEPEAHREYVLAANAGRR